MLKINQWIKQKHQFEVISGKIEAIDVRRIKDNEPFSLRFPIVYCDQNFRMVRILSFDNDYINVKCAGVDSIFWVEINNLSKVENASEELRNKLFD